MCFKDCGGEEIIKSEEVGVFENLVGKARGIYYVVIAYCARSEESTGVDSEEKLRLSEEKLLRSLSEPVSGKPTPRLVGTRCARGDESGGQSPCNGRHNQGWQLVSRTPNFARLWRACCSSNPYWARN